jgi:hypothetical protein
MHVICTIFERTGNYSTTISICNLIFVDYLPLDNLGICAIESVVK